jgi:hypothetical protein
MVVEKSRKKVRRSSIAEKNELLCGEALLKASWNTFPATDFRTAQTTRGRWSPVA